MKCSRRNREKDRRERCKPTYAALPASLQCANNCFLSFLFGEDDCPTSFLLPTVSDESHSALSGKGCPRTNGHSTGILVRIKIGGGRKKEGKKKRIVGRRKGLFRLLLLLFLTVLVKSPRVPGSIGGFGIRGKKEREGEKRRDWRREKGERGMEGKGRWTRDPLILF